MKKYQVEITETLQRIVEVEAKNEKNAILKVAENYKDGNIVLDEGDFMGYEITLFPKLPND